MGESDEDFIALGDELVEALTEHAGLREDSRVLDIGCGYGRLPHALKRRGFAGTYLGIDVLERHVRWCTKRLGDPRFRFRHADIKNERYNPNGSQAVGDLDLGDERFDVIAAFSVFTHMWPEDVKAYLRLAAGALAPTDAWPRPSSSSTTFGTNSRTRTGLRSRCRSSGSPGAAMSPRTTPCIESRTREAGWF